MRVWPLVAALAMGLALGWLLFHAREPAVHEVADLHAKAAAQQDVQEDVGGWTRTTYEYAAANTAAHGAAAQASARNQAAAAPSGGGGESADSPFLSAVIVERHDPTIIATHTTSQTSEDRHLDLTITPATQTGWAAQAGVEGLAARTLRLAVRRRLLGPFWVELSAIPAQRSVGVAASVEW